MVKVSSPGVGTGVGAPVTGPTSLTLVRCIGGGTCLFFADLGVVLWLGVLGGVGCAWLVLLAGTRRLCGAVSVRGGGSWCLLWGFSMMLVVLVGMAMFILVLG
jgi:hypothetical protein